MNRMIVRLVGHAVDEALNPCPGRLKRQAFGPQPTRTTDVTHLVDQLESRRSRQPSHRPDRFRGDKTYDPHLPSGSRHRQSETGGSTGQTSGTAQHATTESHSHNEDGWIRTTPRCTHVVIGFWETGSAVILAFPLGFALFAIGLGPVIAVRELGSSFHSDVHDRGNLVVFKLFIFTLAHSFVLPIRW